MTSLHTRHMAECREQQGKDDAGSWHETAKAQELLGQLEVLSLLIDSLRGLGLPDEHLCDRHDEITNDLVELRWDAVFVNDGDEDVDDLDEFAPTVSQAIVEYRRKGLVTVHIDIAPDSGCPRVAA